MASIDYRLSIINLMPIAIWMQGMLLKPVNPIKLNFYIIKEIKEADNAEAKY